MLEKPALPDEAIIACLGDRYAVAARSVEFLPLGNDSSAWVYRVTTENGQDYFLKVKKGSIPEPTVSVPHFLNALGISQVVAPLPTRDQHLSQPLGDFTLILYPFIEGITGMEKGLTTSQWIKMGTILKKIHSAVLPDTLPVKRETFVPAWAQMARELHSEILSRTYDEPFEKELAAFWRGRQEEIIALVDHTEALGQSLQSLALDFVLCHCDIHTANVLVDPQDQLHIVDWDGPLLAPKERDLMFMMGSDTEALFFQGYGTTEVNADVIAYYRYEWVVQEIGDFGERVFRMTDIGKDTKQDSVWGFKRLFDPDNVVDGAYNSQR